LRGWWCSTWFDRSRPGRRAGSRTWPGQNMQVSQETGVVRQLSAAAELNTTLYLNCLQSVSTKDALLRPNHLVNSLAFVACHVLDARHYLARFIGLSLENPLEPLLARVQSIEEVETLPPLETVREQWRAVSSEVCAVLRALAPRELASPSPQRFPISDVSFGGALEFQLHHESYHIGQLAYIRKFYGYPAMSYRWQSELPRR
jgi:uncharacterized damage-inducible protein DinB